MIFKMFRLHIEMKCLGVYWVRSGFLSLGTTDVSGLALGPCSNPSLWDPAPCGL